MSGVVLPDDVVSVLVSDARIQRVELTGSRARGASTELLTLTSSGQALDDRVGRSIGLCGVVAVIGPDPFGAMLAGSAQGPQRRWPRCEAGRAASAVVSVDQVPVVR